MRSLALAILLATPLSAETISEEIARTGLHATETRLAALPSPTNEDLFALAGLRFLGYSSNTKSEEELQKARDVVVRWKKNLAKFENEQYKSGLANGEFLLVHGYVGDLLQIQAQNPDIGIFFPKEGFVMTCDCLVIPQGARNVELAHKWINFMLDPQIAAQNTEFMQYLCPNKDAYPLLSESIRNNPAVILPEEVKARGEVNLDLGEENAKYTKTWDEIRAAD